jgi:4-amino-4-deoxy-L-arabinose transferase-like glycosyltransferase
MLARMAVTVGVFTHTYDEPYHVGAAVGIFEAKEHVLGVQHPALSRMVPGLALVLRGVELPQYRGTSTIRSEAAAFNAGYDVMMGSAERYWMVLRTARLAMLVFPALALLYVYLLGRYLASGLVALLATVFFSIEPTMLGNGALVTTDGPACAGFLVALYHGLRWIARPTWKRTVIGAVALAVAVALKFSTLLIVPALGLVMLMRPLFGHRRRGRMKWLSGIPPLARLAAVAVGSYLVLWATFLFQFGPIADQDVFSKHPEWNRIPAVVRNTPVPMPSLLMGGFILAGHNKVGHVSYLNGQISTHGEWYFFPETLVVKQPVGFLVAFAVAMVVFLIRRNRVERCLVLLVPAAVFMGVSMMGNMKLGIRHVMPLIPLLYLFTCFVLARGRLLYVLLACMALAAFETARVHPDYLGYFNFAVGGVEKGDRYLVGSDMDWGQDVARLAHWLKTEAPNSGTSMGPYYTLRLYVSNPEQLLPLLGLNPGAMERPPAGLFAISTSTKRGLADFQFSRDGTRKYGPDYTWLERFEPIKRIGASIEVYDLREVPTTAPATGPSG